MSNDADGAAPGAERDRVLCVDDDPDILRWLRRALQQQFEVVTAVNGDEGLRVVREESPFAVIITDLDMPAMDGVAFLERARPFSPDSSRILLTGRGSLKSAIEAVNRGEINQYLSKPCQLDTLLRAVTAAAERHRLITAERVLLEQTLRGCIKALTDVLALVHPAGFGRALRTRKLASALAHVAGHEPAWEVEVAAMLVQVGSIALPATTVEKYYRGDKLTVSEQHAIRQMPRIASDMIADIPRLEGVRSILRRQDTRHDPASDQAEAALTARTGADILRLVVEFDALQSLGMSSESALSRLRGLKESYKSPLLDALGDVCGTSGEQIIAEIDLESVYPGLVIAEDIRSSRGILLIARGQEVTQRLAVRIRGLVEAVGPGKRVRVILPVQPPGARAEDSRGRG